MCVCVHRKYYNIYKLTQNHYIYICVCVYALVFLFNNFIHWQSFLCIYRHMNISPRSRPHAYPLHFFHNLLSLFLCATPQEMRFYVPVFYSFPFLMWLFVFQKEDHIKFVYILFRSINLPLCLQLFRGITREKKNRRTITKKGNLFSYKRINRNNTRGKKNYANSDFS